MAVCWYNTNQSGFARLWMICIRIIVRGFKKKQAVAGEPFRQTGGFLYTAPVGGISLSGPSGCDAINNVMLAVAKLQDSNFTGRENQRLRLPAKTATDIACQVQITL